MCELTEVTYMPNDVVWVKLGSCWWPGEVKDLASLPEGVAENFKKPPLAVVKFFSEDSYEYVRNLDNIYHYNNRRKQEFIKKGMDLTRAKTKAGSSVMDKFPTDVITAESLTNGDINILSTDAFMPKERPQYKDLFGSPGKKKSAKKNGVGRPSSDSKYTSDRKSNDSILGKVNSLIQIKQRITHPRFVRESDHEVRIRQQPVSPVKEAAEVVNHAYKCQQCDFGTSRQNVFILHCKAHRENILKPAGKTPTSAASKKRLSKASTPKSSTPKSSTSRAAASTTSSVAKSTPTTSREKKESPKTPKEPASSSAARRKIFQSSKKGGNKKGAVPSKEAQVSNSPVKSAEAKERDLEKRNRILADWDDEDEEEEEKEIKKIKLELDKKPDSEGESSKSEKSPFAKSVLGAAKGGAPATLSTDPSSVYDLIDDAEEFVPPPRMSESKRPPPPPPAPEPVDTGELDKEVASLLEETAVPELPQVPTFSIGSLKSSSEHQAQTNNIPLKSEENVVPQNSNEAVREMSDLSEMNGDINGKNLSMETEEVFTVPASTLSTVISPTASKANGTLTSETTMIQSQATEIVVNDPNSETATYVLVTLDDSGGFQQFQALEGNTTLLAYDNSQVAEGGQHTLYIDSSQLEGSDSGYENIFLAIDPSDGTMQLQPQQVSLQVSGAETVAEEMGRSKQDILAEALANTQVLQPTLIMGQEAVVKVTNTAQSPVMTPRVAESHLTLTTQQNIDTASSILTLGDPTRR